MEDFEDVLAFGRLFVHPHPVSELDGDAQMFFRKASTSSGVNEKIVHDCNVG